MKYSKKMILIDPDEKTGSNLHRNIAPQIFEVKTNFSPPQQLDNRIATFARIDDERLSSIDGEIMKTLQNKSLSTAEKVQRYAYLVKRYLLAKAESQLTYEQGVDRSNDEITKKLAERLMKEGVVTSREEDKKNMKMSRPSYDLSNHHFDNLDENAGSILGEYADLFSGMATKAEGDSTLMSNNRTEIVNNQSPDFQGFSEGEQNDSLRMKWDLLSPFNKKDFPDLSSNTTLMANSDLSRYSTPTASTPFVKQQQAPKKKKTVKKWDPLKDQIRTRPNLENQ